MGEMPGYRAENFEVVAYHDLEESPAFKLALDKINDRWYLYAGSFWSPHVLILDVTDPASPQLVNKMRGAMVNTATYNLQVHGGVMVLALEKGGWGKYADNENPAFEEGIRIYDLKEDPACPKLVSEWHTGALGTHRNHYDGSNYIHLTSRRKGYPGFVYVILDISDITRPVEIGHWHPSEQYTDGGGVVHDDYNGLHGPAQIIGDRAYLSYGSAGAIILDISDLTLPKEISRLTYGNAFHNRHGVHTYLPIYDDRKLAIISGEANAEDAQEPMSFAFLADMSDETRPRMLSWFPTPAPSKDMPYKNFHTRGGRFGPHNWHVEQPNNPYVAKTEDIVYNCWFNAGLRAFDISDPYVPRETGFFLPDDPKKRIAPLPRALTTSSEDVIVDARGNIYISDKNHGLFILRYTG